MTPFSPQPRILLGTIHVLVATLLISVAHAEDWKRVTSKDGKISALFPVDIRKNKQSQSDRTIAGNVTTYFGEHHGEGIMLAGSGAGLPKLAQGRENRVYETTKKGFLKEAGGKEISFKSTTVGGAPARELIYEGKAYRGKGDPYKGRALIIILNKRVYIVNSVISKPTDANKAAEKKLLGSIKVEK